MDHWANCCRSCLRRAESFSHFIYQHITPEQYFYCTSIEIKLHDQLPKALCEECFVLLNQFIQFKTRCTQSEGKLFTFFRGLYKDEPYSGLEEKCANFDFHVALKDEHQLHAEEVSFGLKIKIEDTTESEKQSELRNSIDNITDSQETGLDEDSKDHVDVAKISCVSHTRSTKKSINPMSSLQRNYKCEQCSKTFLYRQSLQRHLRLHERKTASKDSLVCKTCNKTFTRKWNLQAHIKAVHTKYSFEEMTCQASIDSRVCKACNKPFKSKWSLQSHIKAMHTKYSFEEVTCQVCSKVFKNPSTLKVHMKTHEKRKGQMCDECGKVFKSDVTFKNHLKTHVKNRVRNFTCEHCGKKYISKHTLAIHVHRRHTNRQFICDYCQYVFTEKSCLARHILLHEGRQPKYDCDICFRSLASKASLRNHKRIHTGEQPYTCKHCPKSFSDRAYLVGHERIHTGEKPFQCPVCELRFSMRKSMRRHMKVHTGKVVERNIEGIYEENKGNIHEILVNNQLH